MSQEKQFNTFALKNITWKVVKTTKFLLKK